MFLRLLIFTLFVTSGCEYSNGHRWTRIGTYIPRDLTSDEINAVLAPANIPFTSEGSRAYALEVPAKDVWHAETLLKNSAIANRIHFSN